MVGFLGYPSAAFGLGYDPMSSILPSTDVLGAGSPGFAPSAASVSPPGSILPSFGTPQQASPFGMNMDTARLGLAGIGTLGSLWGAFQASSLAKKQFNYTKGVTETNLANQLKTYNTQLQDRANNRAIVEGRSPAETAAYFDANKLSRYGR